MKKLLMISTDRKILEQGSDVRARQIEYAKGFEEVHIIVFAKKSKGAETESALSSNCWAYSTQSRSRFLYAHDAIRLGRFIMEKRGITDITCQDPFQTAMAGVSLKKQFPSASLEIQVHTDIGSPNFGYTIGNKMRSMLAFSYIPKADHVRVVSNKIRNFLVTDSRYKIQEGKIEVRPVAVDVEWIKSAPILPNADLHTKYPHFDKIILMASRLEKEKDIGLAIRAFKEVLAKRPKMGLIIVGEGTQRDGLRSCALRLAPQNVAFEGWADKATLASYYKTADVFLSTSLFEGYGMTFIEAQAAGCPIVSTDAGIAREMGATLVDWSEESVARGVLNALEKNI